jgi:hypothetical protein
MSLAEGTKLGDDEMWRQHKDGWAWVLFALAEGMAARRSASRGD